MSSTSIIIKTYIFLLCLINITIISTPLFSQKRALPHKNKLDVIVIDAGHGGKDPGCHGIYTVEKDVNLDIALLLGKMIKEQFPNIKIYYTRMTDNFIELTQRAKIANRNKADLFISIHCNATDNPQVKGTETFVIGLHKTDENLEVSIRENKVITLEKNYQDVYNDFDPTSPEDYIIFSLYQSAHIKNSMLFANIMEQQFENHSNRLSRGVKQAGLLVLYETTMPSILIEVGFLTNAEEEALLFSNDGKESTVKAIFQTFKLYKKQIEH